MLSTSEVHAPLGEVRLWGVLVIGGLPGVIAAPFRDLNAGEQCTLFQALQQSAKDSVL